MLTGANVGVAILLMDDANGRKRITWTARISIRPSVREAIAKLADDDRVSIAHQIGTALAEYVTARST